MQKFFRGNKHLADKKVFDFWFYAIAYQLNFSPLSIFKIGKWYLEPSLSSDSLLDIFKAFRLFYKYVTTQASESKNSKNNRKSSSPNILSKLFSFLREAKQWKCILSNFAWVELGPSDDLLSHFCLQINKKKSADYE